MNNDILNLIAKSEESILHSYNYAAGRLVLSLEMPEFTENEVAIEIETSIVKTAVPESKLTALRTCFIELLEPVHFLEANENSIFMPPQSFPELMKQVREGASLAYGQKISEVGYIFRLMSSYPLILCLVKNISCVKYRVNSLDSC